MTPDDHADVVIVGAGIVGLSVAYELARAHVPRIVVLDAGNAGHQSTGRSTGGIRRQFGSALEVHLTEAALEIFAPMFADPDFDGRFERDGYLFLAGAGQRAQLYEAYELQRSLAVPTEWLDVGALRDGYPFLDLAGIAGATFCADDGFVEPFAIVQWLLRQSRRLGVVIRTGRQVDRIDVECGRVLGVTAGGEHLRAPVVVNAAGAWAGVVGALAGVSIPVRPSPRVQIVTERQHALPSATPLIVDLMSGSYFRSIAGCVLAGISPTTNPTGFETTPSVDDVEAIAAAASARCPGLYALGISQVITGLYEMTPDGLPVASFGEDVEGFCTVAGFNGHGIMHSPPLARGLADMIVSGRTRFNLEPFSVKRFRSGARPDRRSSSLL
jgi:sarcosine oxidase subunit beta